MGDTHYWTGEESVPSIIWANALAPGKCKWIGDQCGRLYSPDGQYIGSFHRSSHGGWSVWTKPYAGWADASEVEIRPCPKGDECEYAYIHYPLKEKHG
jgi:hypothetical protein